MLQQAQQAASLIQKQQKMQAMLASVTVQGSSKNGKVTVVMDGQQKIKSIEIAPELIKFVYETLTSVGKNDTMLGKSIVEAFEDAISKVQEAVIKKMQEENSFGDLSSIFSDATAMMQQNNQK